MSVIGGVTGAAGRALCGRGMNRLQAKRCIDCEDGGACCDRPGAICGPPVVNVPNGLPVATLTYTATARRFFVDSDGSTIEQILEVDASGPLLQNTSLECSLNGEGTFASAGSFREFRDGELFSESTFDRFFSAAADVLTPSDGVPAYAISTNADLDVADGVNNVTPHSFELTARTSLQQMTLRIRDGVNAATDPFALTICENSADSAFREFSNFNDTIFGEATSSGSLSVTGSCGNAITASGSVSSVLTGLEGGGSQTDTWTTEWSMSVEFEPTLWRGCGGPAPIPPCASAEPGCCDEGFACGKLRAGDPHDYTLSFGFNADSIGVVAPFSESNAVLPNARRENAAIGANDCDIGTNSQQLFATRVVGSNVGSGNWTMSLRWEVEGTGPLGRPGEVMSFRIRVTADPSGAEGAPGNIRFFAGDQNEPGSLFAAQIKFTYEPAGPVSLDVDTGSGDTFAWLRQDGFAIEPDPNWVSEVAAKLRAINFVPGPCIINTQFRARADSGPDRLTATFMGGAYALTVLPFVNITQDNMFVCPQQALRGGCPGCKERDLAR